METEAALNPSISNQVCVFNTVAVETVYFKTLLSAFGPITLAWHFYSDATPRLSVYHSIVPSGRKILGLFFFCSSPHDTRPAGIYSLSNSLLDTPWRKLQEGRRHFTSVVNDQSLSSDGLVQELLTVLSNEDLWVSLRSPASHRTTFTRIRDSEPCRNTVLLLLMNLRVKYQLFIICGVNKSMLVIHIKHARVLNRTSSSSSIV